MRSVAEFTNLIVRLASDIATVEIVGAEPKRWWQFWKRTAAPFREPAQTGLTVPMTMRTGFGPGQAGPSQTGFTEPMPMRGDCGPVYQTPSQTGHTEPMPLRKGCGPVYQSPARTGRTQPMPMRGAVLTAARPVDFEPVPTARHTDSATIQILCEPPRRGLLEGSPAPAPWASTVEVITGSGDPSVIPLRQSSVIPLSSDDEDEVDTSAQTIRRTRLTVG